MPGDIRSFFGGGDTAKANLKTKEEPPKKAGRGRPRKVVSDDEDDVEETKPNRVTPVKRKAAKEEPKEEETTSLAYFANSKSKPAKTSTNGAIQTPKKSTTANGATPGSARRSGRRATAARISYAENSDDNAMKVDDGKDGGDDDIHAEDFKVRRQADDYEEASDDNDDMPIRPRKQVNAKKKTLKDDDSDLEMAEIGTTDGAGDSKRKPAARRSTARKRKLEDDNEEEEDETPKKKTKKASTTRKPTQKNAEEPDNSEVSKLLEEIGTVRPPTPPEPNGDRKFKFKPGGGNAGVTPAGHGAKEIPEGAENCLAGMTFVFTGVLETLGREEGQALVKKYGGKITSAPSSKTSFVVLGNEAGPKKLDTIKKLNIKTIDEDKLFAMIKRMPANGGDSKAAEKHAEKKVQDEEKMRKEAEEMEKQEQEKQRRAEKDAKTKAAARGLAAPEKPKGPKVDDRLWVDKYAPDSMTSVCGNKGLVEKLANWLRKWPTNHARGFKQAGADGTGIYRAAMLHGPPGIGKTTAAHLVARLEGYDVVESNASDTRSKRLVEDGLKGVLDTTSLLGFFAGDGKKVDAKKQKLVLIMDEVDGMSAGDRGGVGALAAAAKKTNVPMILICNDRRLPKMKPFDFVTADFSFRRPTTDMIRSRIMTICYREGMRLPTNVVDAIIEGSNADIRQIINMVSTIKLDTKQMDYNDSKAMSKAWEKHVILKPWDIVNKILRAEMFSEASKSTLNEKIELYFNDHEFSYLMLQENYLKTRMARPGPGSGEKHNLKLLDLAEKAAESISDGDLVDRMIHGSQQQWSLMPTHAVFSFVKPASYVYGNLGQQVGFTSWLGNNSKQGKLTRYIKEIQSHMRLRTSADRHEIRQQYMPALWNQTVGKMKDQGKDAVPEVIDFMDSYYLTKDDYDAMLELGLGPMDAETVKMDTQTKATFTRMYNAQDHPLPFIKASSVGNAAAKMSGGKREKPDLEEAVDESEDEAAPDGQLEAAEEGSEEELDLKKDKYVKMPKKKAVAKGKAKAGGDAKGKGRGKKVKEESDEEEEEEEVKPKKRGAPAGRGRGRGRGKG